MAGFEILDEGSASPTAAPATGFEILSEPRTFADTAKDVAKSAGAGYLKGVAGLVGAPADITKTAGNVLQWAEKKITGDTDEQYAARVAERQKRALLPSNLLDWAGSQNITSGLEALGGPLHKPETTAGRYAQTVAEFVPGAGALGAGGVGRRVLTQAAIPGVAAEAAGSLPGVKDTAFEPGVRAGAAFLSGGASALATAPRSSETALSRAMRGVDQGAIDRAGALINDAAQQGVRLTWDEAIQQVTGGATRLGDLRRVVENSRGGGDVLKPLMAERAAQVQAAGDQAIGAIAPNRMDPVRAGLANQHGAERELADAQTAVNNATRADYAAAERYAVGPQVQQALLGDPLYERSLMEVTTNPEFSAGINHLPTDNVGVLNLAQRRLRELADNRRAPGEANTSNLAAANLENARTAPLEAAERATGGPYGDFARARATQAQLRQNFLEPLTEGPLGSVRDTSDVMKQGRAVLPSTPAPGSEGVVAETVSRLARQNPDAAAGLIHSQIRSAFDEATQNLASGPNQFGGAKFAAVVAGNGQQATNLEAAVRALPNGDQRWDGFRRFLDTMEATGQRPQPGSMTAFNAEFQKELKHGGVKQETAMAAGTGGVALIKRLMDFREQLNLGRNTEQLARILVDPRAGQLLERIATAPQSQLPVLALRLSYMGRQGFKSAGPGYRSTPDITVTPADGLSSQ